MFILNELKKINSSSKKIEIELRKVNNNYKNQLDKICSLLEQFSNEKKYDTGQCYNDLIKANNKMDEILREKEKYRNHINKIYSLISYFFSILYGTILSIGNLLFEDRAYIGVILCIVIGIIIAIVTYFQTPWEGCQENKLSKIFISLFKEMKEKIFDTSLIMLSPFFIELMSIFFLWLFRIRQTDFENDIGTMAYQIVLSSMSFVSVVIYFVAVFAVSGIAILIKSVIEKVRNKRSM